MDDVPTLDGPCIDCGTPTRRRLRPGRALRCIECAIAHHQSYVRRQATPGTPEHTAGAVAGREAAAAISAREGPVYDRYRAGIARALGLVIPD